MAVKPEGDFFSLAQKISRENSITLGAQVTLGEQNSDLFSGSLLGMDDTVLKTINLNNGFESRQDNLTTVTDDNVNYQNDNSFNYNNNKAYTTETKDHNYNKSVNNQSLDDALLPMESWEVTESAQVFMEVEDAFDSMESSTCYNQRLCNNTTAADSGIEKSKWEDDSLLDQVFNEMESSSENMGTETKTGSRKHALLAPKNHCDPTAIDAGSFESSNSRSRQSTIRKSSVALIDESVSNKKLCTDTKSSDVTKNFKSFYGLPSRVKSLVQHVKGIDELYEWQDECLKLNAIENRRNLIYALPTSGGKTLVAEILMFKELIVNKKNAIFVLPFVAIVQEKVRSLAPFALELDFLVEEYAAGHGQYPPRKRRRKRTIYVCTIEKALGLVNSLIENQRLDEVGIVVVDELHLLGEDGGRGATLEVLLTKVMCSKADPHIIGMSATIGNLNDIAKFLNAVVYTKDFRPVELKEYVKCSDDIWLVDVKQSEILTDLKKISYPYSKKAIKLDPDRLGGLVMDVIPKDSCLIFCPTRKNCENVAMLLIKVLFKSLQEHNKKEKEILIRALRAEGALCEILERTIPFGVAYHHSGLTSEERRLLEEAFRSGTLCVICCTSTLAAGVNLPARRVILRHPYVGNQFLNLSRYKQMIGRAGRAGMKEVGESILICRTNEIPKVKELLTSKMDDCISTIHTAEDRGMDNLVLSSILLNLATNRSELHKITEGTLLGIQQKKLNIDTKKVTDKTIRKLVKAGVLKVKQVTNNSEIQPDVTVDMQTQQDGSKKFEALPAQFKAEKKIIKLNRSTKLEVCKLGRAAMKGCIDINRARMLYKDLKTAQSQLVLLDCLHLLYLVTPYDIADQVKLSGNVYCEVVCGLSETQMETARVLGINENVAAKLRSGIMPTNVDPYVVNRFYLTLMLNELLNQQTIHVVSTKYQVNRGIVQNLINAAASFASSVERFCAELDEFWAFRDLLHSFCKKLSHCCVTELEPLMELSGVRIGRARQLFVSGYKTLKSLAIGDPKDMCEKIENLPFKVATQIVAAAKLLLLEKLENYRDEAAELSEGIDLSQF